MITRPLDLADKLRPAPRNFDALFFVNVALIVVFFSLFGSRFVLAPGMPIEQMAGADKGARPTTHFVSVIKAGQVFAGDGLRNNEQLQQWLIEQAKTVKEPTLLIRAKTTVATSVILEIASMADAAGFKVQLAVSEPEARKKGG